MKSMELELKRKKENPLQYMGSKTIIFVEDTKDGS